MAEQPAGEQSGCEVPAAVQLLVPAIFGITVLVVWELLVRGLAVSLVILPAPTVIASAFAGSHAHRCGTDLVQTS